MTLPKRLFDMTLALCLCALLAPVLAGIALWLRGAQGRGVLYAAVRIGQGGRAFTLWKFRTMVPARGDSGVSGGDKTCRITAPGRVLRRFRLDELPQLWNILRGEMSFVGPRPPLRDYVDRFPALYGRVLRTRPGVTGLATLVFHRHEARLLAGCVKPSETDAVYARRCVPRKARLDLIYADHASLCFDLALMARTLTRVVRGQAGIAVGSRWRPGSAPGGSHLLCWLGRIPVLSRLRGLFHRYAARHLSLDSGAAPLSIDSPWPVPPGYIDRVVVAGTRVTVSGWTLAETVSLRWEGGQVSTTPDIARADVARAHGAPRCTGFELEAPLDVMPFDLVLHRDGVTWTVPLPGLSRSVLRRARARLMGRFARDLARALPALLRYAQHPGPLQRERIKQCLRLGNIAVSAPLETRLFTFDPAETLTYPTDRPITIVMPVYNALKVTRQALSHVARHTDTPWHLVVIEDCSTDPEVRPWLRDWAAEQNAAHAGRVTLIEQAVNQGFIGAVNAGLDVALARGHTTVLLNSDALVPAGWASRLIRPLFEHENVASVTPMSNDAEILSVPVICQHQPLRPGEGAALDALAARFHPEALLSVLPTGVGFCMALHIDWLRRVPRLDPVFGRGYGEEVDWCQRVAALGGRHLGLPGLVVEHRGGESFGSAQKQALIQANSKVLSERYPAFDRQVQDFIAVDPLRTARLALAICLQARRAGAQPVTLAVAHALGGGAEHALQQRLARAVARDGCALVLRVGGRQRWQIELLTAQGVISGGTDEFAFVTRLLAPVTRRHVLYSCGVGDRDPVTLPDILRALKRGPADRLEILFHDYFPISPAYCLLDAEGRYRGVPDPDRADPAHRHHRPDGRVVSLADWQTAWGRALAAAEEIVVFSQDSRALVAQAYPAEAARITVRPHRLRITPARLPGPARTRPPVIGVLGNIGYQKGAGVVQAMASRLAPQGAARLVVVGSVDPAFALPKTTPVHGAYRVAELDRIAAHYGLTCWLIPSIWPETFSYTTHEALATGLPVWGFGLGAQGAALAAAANGHIIPFDPDADLAARALAGMSGPAAQAQRCPVRAITDTAS